MSGEKTEKPTPKKLKEARKKGQIPRTPDLAAWTGLMAASFVIPWSGGMALDRCQDVLLRAVKLVEAPDTGAAMVLLVDGMTSAALIVLPLGLTLMALTLVSGVAQGGVTLATKKLKPDFKHLNPINGLKRLLGPQGVWEAIKTLLKVTVLGLVVLHAGQGVKPLIADANSLPLGAVLGIVSSTALTAVREAAAAGLLLAAADYAVIRKQMMKGLKMSKQDIKDEYKQAEGDPHVKAQIKARQMAMSRNRMMADVASADVVLVNPTHVAVALKYDPAKGAPRIVAKGQGLVAAKIRELADLNRVPMVQDVPLARALHKSVEVGGEVPPELYNPVARVLAFVLSLKARGSAAGIHRVPVAAGG